METQLSLERLTRLETLMQGLETRVQGFAEQFVRLASEHRAATEAQNAALSRMQERNIESRREDQEMHRRELERLQEEGRQARVADQRDFQAAMTECLKKIEQVASGNSAMADKFIKREDLLWLRQAVGSVIILLGGGLWTWFLDLHK